MDEKHVVIKSDEERLVHGEVYRPFEVDSQGDVMTPEAIKLAAHTFLSKGLVGNIDDSHDRIPTGSKVVESYIAKKDDPDGFAEKSWVLVVKVLSDEKWAMVKSGELNGYSFSGMLESIPAKVTVSSPINGSGITEKSIDGLLPEHDHAISLTFKDGKLQHGETEESLGHTHSYFAVTSTEKEFDHAHRIILEE